MKLKLIFYCENKWKPEFIFDLPPHASFYDMYADGNRFYIKNGLQIDRTYRAMDKRCSFKKIVSMIGDTNAEYLCKDPFKDENKSTVGFRDTASVSSKSGADSRIPVTLSKPINEDCTIYYTVWDYDAGTVLYEGRLHFDRFETEKQIHVKENDKNILIEISGV